MKELFNKVKRGVNMVKDKVINKIENVLYDRNNRVVYGITIMGMGLGLAIVGGSLIVSGYIKLSV